MLVQLDEVVKACPVPTWEQNVFTIDIRLLGDQALILRGRIRDIAGYTCNAADLKKTAMLQEKPDGVISAVVDLINARKNKVAKEFCDVVEIATAIIIDLKAKCLTLDVLCQCIDMMEHILREYEPQATLAGWHKWFRMCEAYLLQF